MFQFAYFFYSSFWTKKNYLLILFGHFRFVDDTLYYPFTPLGHLLMLCHIIHSFRSVICWCYVTLSIYSVRSFVDATSHYPFIPLGHLFMLRHIIHLFRSVICSCYVTLSIITLPFYSMRARPVLANRDLIWYPSVYFHCKYFTLCSYSN